MSDISIRVTGKAGRITLTRAGALNALNYDMCLAVDAALQDWQDNPDVKLVIIDAEGDKAFCAGGDIAELYAQGRAGNFAYGQKFWRDEYQMNARIFSYPKPVVSLLQGFVMGGGVGLGCHGSHRIVGETTKISMPEVAIGLVPDVGGSLMLALAPGRLGEYLALTASRLKAADAVYAGFADHFIPQALWPALISELENSGDVGHIETLTQSAGVSDYSEKATLIDALFNGETLADIEAQLTSDGSQLALETLEGMAKHSPLAMASAVEVIHRLRASYLSIEKALELEYRFTYRAQEHSDFLEGIRALIIDKDRRPQWRHAGKPVPVADVSQMLMPLGAARFRLTSDLATEDAS